MELYFKTKINKVGNTYRLCIDLDSKIIKTGYSCSSCGDYIVITRQEMRQLKEKFKENGYKEI